MEQLINFETAKMAKEAGFDWDCNDYYTDNNKPASCQYYDDAANNFPKDTNECLSSGTCIYARPTQPRLQKWLRDVHGIQIDIESTSYDGEIVSYSFTTWSPRFRAEKKDVNISYELCLEDALQEALKLVMSK